jgi:hypothetical protein
VISETSGVLMARFGCVLVARIEDLAIFIYIIKIAKNLLGTPLGQPSQSDGNEFVRFR